MTPTEPRGVARSAETRRGVYDAAPLIALTSAGDQLPLPIALASAATAPIMALMIRKRTSAYSAAEAPDSSLANRRALVIDGPETCRHSRSRLILAKRIFKAPVEATPTLHPRAQVKQRLDASICL